VNLSRVVAVAWKEWREIFRDPLFLALVFLVPAMLMLLFGYGLSLDVENIAFAVVDYDQTAASREYAYRFIDSHYFAFRGYVHKEHELEPELMEGRLRAAIIIPEHFQQNLLEGRAVGVQTLIDGTFPYRAQVIKSYVSAIAGQASLEHLAGHLARQRGFPAEQARHMLRPVRLEVRFLYNQGVKSDWTLAPPLIMVILILASPLYTSLGVVRERESGSIFNVFASTATRAEFLAGKLGPYALVSLVNGVVLFVLATTLFGAPFRGDPVLFWLATVVYVVCTTGIGLVVSVLVRTQVAAMVITSVITVLPAILYSGLFVPVPSLSTDAQIVAHLLPAMYYTRIVHGSFLKAVGWDVLWRDVVVLAGYAVAIFAMGYAMFRKRPKR
jgi:ABC-2 type transport system permease protein/ribosome-dependent ATPase